MTHDVLIVGAGPAGLSAAHALRQAGVRDVVVLERDATPGGIPRYCGHPGFGVREFHRVLRGPTYARELAARAKGIPVRTGCSVLALHPGGRITVSTSDGIADLQARAVLLATGIRESPRSARLVSGTRPWGVTTTGAFQEMVHAGQQKPFRHPIIVGSELVAFSNLLTAREAGIRPIAIIEENDRVQTAPAIGPLARALFHVPVLLRTRLVEIRGLARVEGVLLDDTNGRRELACDGVIFSGNFVPEAALVRGADLAIDPQTGGPAIDAFWRCSDPAYFAAGNVLRPVETAGWSSREGQWVADAIRRALSGELPDSAASVSVRTGGRLRYAYPQHLHPSALHARLYGRAAGPHRGMLQVMANGVRVAERRVSRRPQARLAIDVPATALAGCSAIDIILE